MKADQGRGSTNIHNKGVQKDENVTKTATSELIKIERRFCYKNRSDIIRAIASHQHLQKKLKAAKKLLKTRTQQKVKGKQEPLQSAWR